MLALGELTVIILLVPLVTLCEGNEKVYDTYFNGFCYWSEDISYHVHYASGCKEYFTCQRGKFLEFKKCPELTTFDVETRRCDSKAICKDPGNVNPTYESWWKKVVEVIDEVFEVLSNSSTTNQTLTDIFSTKEISKMELDASTTVHPTSTLSKTILQTEAHSLHNIDLLDKSSISDTYCKTNIGLKNTKHSDCTDPVENAQIKPSQSVAKQAETDMSSIYFVPKQFDTQNPASTDSLYSSTLPLQAELSKKIDELIEPFKASDFPNLFDTSIVDDFINPLVQDFVTNATFMNKFNHFVNVMFKTMDPLFYQILDQYVDKDMGTIRNISLKELTDAWTRTSYTIGPLLCDIIPHLHYIFFRRVLHIRDPILNYYVLNNASIKKRFSVLFTTLLDLVYKYRSFFSSSPPDITITYSVLDIRKEFQNFFKMVTNGLTDRNDRAQK